MKLTEHKDGFKVETKPKCSIILKYLGAFWLVFWFSGIGIGAIQSLNSHLPESSFYSISELGVVVWIIVASLVGLIYLNYWVHQVFGTDILILKGANLEFIRTRRIDKIKWSIPFHRIHYTSINNDFFTKRIRLRGVELINPEGAIVFRVGRKNYYFGNELTQKEAGNIIDFVKSTIPLRKED